MIPRIGISVGDFNGIGPEIILKSLAAINLEESTPIILAPHSILDFYAKELRMKVELISCQYLDELEDNFVNVLDIPTKSLHPKPGEFSKQSGLLSMQSIELGIELASLGITQALVTAPISKEAVNKAGYQIPGHTEFLAQKTLADEVLMMLVNENLRVALVTAHVPISRVSALLSEDLILRKLRILHHSLINDFGIDSPKIAAFGLNPHAGDGGVIGNEEKDLINPTLQRARSEGINVDGAFPADGFFGQKLHQNYDAILAMYHDQGLIPFKLLSFGSGVNFTAGLPIIRTSPDHGTAFNIAGKGTADPSSFLKAYELAVHLALRKQ